MLSLDYELAIPRQIVTVNAEHSSRNVRVSDKDEYNTARMRKLGIYAKLYS